MIFVVKKDWIALLFDEPVAWEIMQVQYSAKLSVAK
jgi:hypothetical protein